MGKDWDRAVPSVDIWRECLRVLKPGAFAFVMSAPRQDVLSQMIVRLTEAGFDTSFTSLYWTYASGFPKAMNMGKAVDKRNGRSSNDFYAFAEYLKEKREAAGLTKADIDRACNIKSSCYIWEGDKTGTVNVPTMDSYRILKPLLHLDDRYDELIEREEAEREVVGVQKGAMSGWNTDGTTKFVDRDITKAETPAAKALDGSYAGFQPKPAVEVIIVAMKPLSEKTYVDQALKNGKGITWLDDARIPTEENLNGGAYSGGERGEGEWKEGSGFKNDKLDDFKPPTGRFPANLIVSDDALDDGRVQKSGTAVRRNSGGRNIHSETEKPPMPDMGHGDSGGYSRFFSLDAWARTLPFLIVPKASKGEKNAGLEGLPDHERENKYGSVQDARPHTRDGYEYHREPLKNAHPTVKPLKLMSYLITLGSREGDTVLDPFAGSGTTCVASKHLKRNFVGIELSEEYAEIARARVDAV